jgi:endoglucanase
VRSWPLPLTFLSKLLLAVALALAAATCSRLHPATLPTAADQLAVSASPERRSAVPLDTQALSGDVFFFVPLERATQAALYLNGAKRPFRTLRAPHGALGATPVPFSTAVLRDGTHTLRAEVTLSSRKRVTLRSSFQVDNSGARQRSELGLWSVQAGDLYRGTEKVNVYGLNWFGMATPDRAPHGLWTGRSVESFVAQVAELGFTALRLPLSPQTIRPGYPVAPWARAYGADGRSVLEHVLGEAERAGLFVLLSFHTFDPNRLSHDLPGRPFGDGYKKADWLADLRALAELARRYPNVLGIDLCNEPHKLTWDTWQKLASEAGRVVLTTNPNLLVFVEGVANASNNGGYGANWGGNLTQAGDLAGIPGGKLVYSPHVYGPSVDEKDHFNAPDFPANLPRIWDVHFGHLVDKGYTLVVGEFGGHYHDRDRVWQDAFVDYLLEKPIRGFFYWSLNPNSADTGGLLHDDWRTVREDKLELLRRLMRGG